MPAKLFAASLAFVLGATFLLNASALCVAQTLRDRLLAIPSVGPDGPLAEEESAARRLMRREFSRSEAFPVLVDLINHDPAFAVGQTARFCAFVCLLPTSPDMNGVVTISNPAHLELLLQAALNEPIDNRRGSRLRGLIIESLERVDPALVPRVDDAILAMLRQEQCFIFGVVSLVQRRNVTPEPFLDTMRGIAESPETAIPAPWQRIQDSIHDQWSGERLLEERSPDRSDIRLRGLAASVVVEKGGAIDEDIARVWNLDDDTKLAYALALARAMFLQGGPVYTCAPETQAKIASLVGQAAVEWDSKFMHEERDLGIKEFLSTAAASLEARRALAQSVSAAADKIAERIQAGRSLDEAWDAWFVGELRAWAAGVP